MHSPLQIQFVLAFYVSYDPYSVIGSDVYDSEAGRDAKEWLYAEGLVDRDAQPWPQITDRLKAFAEHLLSQPLPVEERKWVIPARKEPPHAD